MNTSLAASVRPDTGAPSMQRQVYLVLLAWSFNVFNSVRVFAYLPNLMTIHHSGDSSQHSLWTWLILAGANATMSAWLYEHNGQQMNKAIAVSIGNAAMCAMTAVVIAAYRF